VPTLVVTTGGPPGSVIGVMLGFEPGCVSVTGTLSHLGSRALSPQTGQGGVAMGMGMVWTGLLVMVEGALQDAMGVAEEGPVWRGLQPGRLGMSVGVSVSG
jgi:hypothetical protein